MGRGLEREFPGGQRAQVERPSHVRVEIELPAVPDGSGTEGFLSNVFGNSVTFSGSPEDVSKRLGRLFPERDPSIPPSQTTKLNGPTSRRALP